MSNLRIYKASAGSGKTYTLALEYIRELLIKHSNTAHHHILAVTFTKDATGEMKDRILSELYGLAFGCEDSKTFRQSLSNALRESGKPMNDLEIQEKSKAVLQAILHDYSHLYITTIDSFFQKILRNLARELGRGSRFNLEMNSTKILSEAVRSLIEQANENPQLLDWLMTYIEERLDEGGHWRVDKEIMDFSRCIFNEYFQEHEPILKRQLDENTKIFKQLQDQHSKIQAECKAFFKETYSSIHSQLFDNQLSSSDFNRNGTVLNFLNKLSEGDFAGANSGSVVVRDCCTDPEKWPSSKTLQKERVIALATSQWMLLLNQTIDVLRKFHTSRMVTRNIHQLGLIWDITNEISRQNAENNRFMLSDTALFLNRMIDGLDTPFVFEKIGAEIKHIMIDEFQDTSRLQWSNFKSLLSEVLAHNHFSLIVGDVKQSIYRWRNGDWNILNGIGNELGIQPKSLNINYRSEKQIISFNNHFFTHAAQLLNEKYASTFGSIKNSPFLSSYDPLDVIQQSQKGEESGFVSIDFISDKSEEMKYDDLVLEKLLEKLQNLCENNLSANQICILTRTNKSIITIAEYLASKRKSNPELAAGHYLNIVSDEAFQLNSSPALRIIIEALRILSDNGNPVCRAKLSFYLQQHSLDASIVPDKGLIYLPLHELTGHLFRLFNLKKLTGQSSYLYSFYDTINSYLRDYPSDIHTFLRYWEDELQYKSVPSGVSIGGIRAMTIHKSKGLQFHTVLLPFCDWDIFPEKNPVIWCSQKEGLYDLELLPVKYNQKMFDTVFLEEYKTETAQSWMDNLNLLYVAFTRAEHNLMILSRNKKKLESHEEIKKVSDILLLSVENIDGLWDENALHYEKGALDIQWKKEGIATDNLLKQTPQPVNTDFISEAFNPDKSIFKQSNKSRQFIHPELPSKEDYVLHGNIMHAIFSYIETMDDIETAVDQLIFEGIILSSEKESYTSEVKQFIRDSQVEDWFSGKYKVYNECTILTEDNGEINTQRPDRVLLSKDQTLIIDYKFGEAHPAHQKQMQRYTSLLQKMHYPNIQAIIWYVEKNQLSIINPNFVSK